MQQQNTPALCDTPYPDNSKLAEAIYTQMQRECVGRSKWDELDGYEQKRFVAVVDRFMLEHKSQLVTL